MSSLRRTSVIELLYFAADRDAFAARVCGGGQHVSFCFYFKRVDFAKERSGRNDLNFLRDSSSFNENKGQQLGSHAVSTRDDVGGIDFAEGDGDTNLDGDSQSPRESSMVSSECLEERRS